MSQIIELCWGIIDFIIHIDVHLKELTEQYGIFTHVILFATVFLETGIIVTPFLPGDSLLFAAGALAALGSLDFAILCALLVVAAILGDMTNYWLARKFGKKFLDNGKIPFVKMEYIQRTEAFYARHGGKTIVLARFVPIICTFAPFVAGVGKMPYRTFLMYNVVGAFAWVFIFVPAGYFFGNIPAVRKNFTLVIFGIIFVSVLPMVFEFIKIRRENRLNALKNSAS